MRLSLLPVASKALCGCQETDFTSQWWPGHHNQYSVQMLFNGWTPVISPVSERISLHSRKSQIFTDLSSDADAKNISDGAKDISLTDSWCAANAFTLFILDCQYLMVPTSSEDTSHEPSLLHSMQRIGSECAWRIVSKLNWRPFHRVNSPLWDPVMRRRPSGVHCKNKSVKMHQWTHQKHDHRIQRHNSQVFELCLKPCEHIWWRMHWKDCRDKWVQAPAITKNGMSVRENTESTQFHLHIECNPWLGIRTNACTLDLDNNDSVEKQQIRQTAVSKTHLGKEYVWYMHRRAWIRVFNHSVCKYGSMYVSK